MEKPKSSGTDYTRLEVGENRLRIVSEVISGWECWSGEEGSRKPIRQQYGFKASQLDDLKVTDNDGNPSKDQKQFYACIVWNYGSEQFECWTPKQASIKNALYALDQDEAWGDPTQYDVIITRTGSGFDTSYAVMPRPQKAFEGDEIPIHNLEALFTGGNPLGDE